MSRPDPAVALTRLAVRQLLNKENVAQYLATGVVSVACSGGADSLALAAATVYIGHQMDLHVHGLVVDHGLQQGSAEGAAHAAAQLRQLSCDQVQVLPCQVTGSGGPEAAARRARYTVLRAALPDPRSLVLLGHTEDDQAETVLLGLGRGSGSRSIAGMRELDLPWARPFLGISRVQTRQVCWALGLEPWLDPHNFDPRFTRVRLRGEALPLLEEVLQNGVKQALARTAAQLREDCDTLDDLASELVQQARDERNALNAVALRNASPAIRRRALREWLLAAGVPEITDRHMRAVDNLIAAWQGQGGIALPGGWIAQRAHGKLYLGCRVGLDEDLKTHSDSVGGFGGVRR